MSKITETDSSDDDILYSIKSDISDIDSNDVEKDNVSCDSDVSCESADNEGVTTNTRQYESWSEKKLKSNLPYYDDKLKLSNDFKSNISLNATPIDFFH
ncbi:unnamed protein product [Rotaria sp. Silwood2]|nr:unnamed protein product [Rotaria sp. Silwood2]CAF3052677.1 unnamed protein product [Rotaria sp. Silwood2]CAF4283367.1 unnamed protein product [Rotaria sp. Silwood2]